MSPTEPEHATSEGPIPLDLVAVGPLFGPTVLPSLASTIEVTLPLRGRARHCRWPGSVARPVTIRPVPSIYSIGPPNDVSVFRNGHQIDLVDFAIDHEHLAHTRMHRSSAKLSGISRPKPLFGQQSPGFIQLKPSNTKTMAALSYDFTLLAGWKWLGFFISGETPSKVWRLRNCAT